MSEPKVTNPSEGDKATPDLTKYVPKDEHEKTLTTVKDLESKLEEAKLSLLDPDYISFLETKRGKKVEKKVEKAVKEISEDDLDGLSSKDLLALSVEKAVEAVSLLFTIAKRSASFIPKEKASVLSPNPL